MKTATHLQEELKQDYSTRPPLTNAQRSNFPPLTARLYPLWRRHSLRLITGQPLTLPREAALLTSLARPARGENWLDAGTSTGFYAGVLSRAGANVIAADISPSMLREAARREPGTPPAGQIDWALLDVTAGDLPPASFDGITIGATLNEVPDPARLLAELTRLLRPGGRLWLMYVTRSASPVQAVLSALGGTTFPDRAQVRAMLPGCTLRHAVVFSPVVFELYEKKSAGEP